MSFEVFSELLSNGSYEQQLPCFNQLLILNSKDEIEDFAKQNLNLLIHADFVEILFHLSQNQLLDIKKQDFSNTKFIKQFFSKRQSQKSQVRSLPIKISFLTIQYFVLMDLRHKLSINLNLICLAALLFATFKMKSCKPKQFTNFTERCYKCNIPTAKAVHCRYCDLCCEQFDHHCFWTGQCIHKENYKYFVVFLVAIMTQVFTNILFQGLKYETFWLFPILLIIYCYLQIIGCLHLNKIQN
uniref:Palmitoyltransferase n=1 Tax=Trepomonas sp. PC1 TaxID=1076344 RepID=A0A146K4A6_9EUKA|eukprot:JAP91750.1 DHHC zinc finger domain-containing protein [Trepomonas sp. PC1]